MAHATPETVVDPTPDHQDPSTVRHISEATSEEYLAAVQHNREELAVLHGRSEDLGGYSSSHSGHTFSSEEIVSALTINEQNEGAKQAELAFGESESIEERSSNIYPLPARRPTVSRQRSQRTGRRFNATRGFHDEDARGGDRDAHGASDQPHIDIKEAPYERPPSLEPPTLTGLAIIAEAHKHLEEAGAHLKEAAKQRTPFIPKPEVRPKVDTEAALAAAAIRGRYGAKIHLDEEPSDFITEGEIWLEEDEGIVYTSVLDPGTGRIVWVPEVDDRAHPSGSGKRKLTKTK